jgi:hypothetical protein
MSSATGAAAAAAGGLHTDRVMRNRAECQCLSDARQTRQRMPRLWAPEKARTELKLHARHTNAEVQQKMKSALHEHHCARTHLLASAIVTVGPAVAAFGVLGAPGRGSLARAAAFAGCGLLGSFAAATDAAAVPARPAG